MRTLAIATMFVALVAAPAFAEPATTPPGSDPAVARLEHALPAGWMLMATDTELVIRHDRPVYVAPEAAAKVPGGPLVTLELRYKLQPRWSAKRLADARAQNAQADAAVVAVRERYGKPAPGPQAEAFARDLAAAQSQHVQMPLCSLGASSLFDGPDTYALLKLPVDPPAAGRECKSIVELVKALCGA